LSRPDAAILVVDDNGDNRYTLCHRLRRQWYTEIEEATNGREVLERVAARPFDLVLLNIMMPKMDGYEVLERLKADETWRHIPVIMIFALSEFDIMVRCIELGAEDYLPKPWRCPGETWKRPGLRCQRRCRPLLLRHRRSRRWQLCPWGSQG
jgi:CheY-like chemotaxis protein